MILVSHFDDIFSVLVQWSSVWWHFPTMLTLSSPVQWSSVSHYDTFLHSSMILNIPPWWYFQTKFNDPLYPTLITFSVQFQCSPVSHDDDTFSASAMIHPVSQYDDTFSSSPMIHPSISVCWHFLNISHRISIPLQWKFKIEVQWFSVYILQWWHF